MGDGDHFQILLKRLLQNDKLPVRGRLLVS